VLDVNGAADNVVKFALASPGPNAIWVGLEVTESGNLSFAHFAHADEALQ
jgi:hypothetical protein